MFKFGKLGTEGEEYLQYKNASNSKREHGSTCMHKNLIAFTKYTQGAARWLLWLQDMLPCVLI